MGNRLNKWLITGDTHANFGRFAALPFKADTTYHIVILGDAGVNYWLGVRDHRLKDQLKQDFPDTVFYLVRGNHESRPEHLKAGVRAYNETVQGIVIQEPDYPNIIYLLDGEEYTINNKKVLVIGGAYSIDKEYRQRMHWQWFEDEQLSSAELKAIEEKHRGKHFDMILSHTCPYSMRPTHLFLPMVDQSKVDNSMELWMEEFKDTISYDLWYWAHYHGDWSYDEKNHMLYENIISL